MQTFAQNRNIWKKNHANFEKISCLLPISFA